MHELARVADELGGEAGLAAVLSTVRELAETNPPALVQYALQLFIVHHPGLPPRGPAPERAPPPLAHRLSRFGAQRAPPGPPGRALLLHAPANARPLRRGPTCAQPPACGAVRRLPRTDPRALRRATQRTQAGRHRPRGRRRQHLRRRLERQRDAVAAVDFKQGDDLKAGLTALAAMEEPELGTPSPDVWHHGAGHIITAWIMHPRSGLPMGAIGNTRSAIRDPFFWRWHKHVDELAYQLQERHEEHRFTEAPPSRSAATTTPPVPTSSSCSSASYPPASVTTPTSRRLGANRPSADNASVIHPTPPRRPPSSRPCSPNRPSIRTRRIRSPFSPRPRTVRHLPPHPQRRGRAQARHLPPLPRPREAGG